MEHRANLQKQLLTSADEEEAVAIQQELASLNATLELLGAGQLQRHETMTVAQLLKATEHINVDALTEDEHVEERATEGPKEEADSSDRAPRLNQTGVASKSARDAKQSPYAATESSDEDGMQFADGSSSSASSVGPQHSFVLVDEKPSSTATTAEASEDMSPKKASWSSVGVELFVEEEVAYLKVQWSACWHCANSG